MKSGSHLKQHLEITYCKRSLLYFPPYEQQCSPPSPLPGANLILIRTYAYQDQSILEAAYSRCCLLVCALACEGECVWDYVWMCTWVWIYVCGSGETAWWLGASSKLGKGRGPRGILIQSDVIRICQPLGLLLGSKACGSFCSSLVMPHSSS